MRIQTAATNLITTRFGDNGFTHTGQKRTNHHHAATQCSTLLHKLVALQVIQVQLVGFEGIGVFFLFRYLHTNITQQLDEVVHIANVRDVTDNHLLLCQQCGTDYLQGLVLSTLWCDSSLQQMAAFNDK